MTTSNRIPGVRTILFDVGNTLAFVDLGRVGRVLANSGHPCPANRLAAAEGAARRAMYRHHEAHPDTTDEERWDAYVGEMFRRIDVNDPEDATVARARLADAHRSENLWSHVPAGTEAVLEELGGRGFRLGVVSNADGRIPDLLASLGLAHRFETIVDSTLVGVEKPDPRIFEIALDRLGESAETAIYIGDFPAVDITGARRAGLRPVLLDPSGRLDSEGCPVIERLEELRVLLPDSAV